MKNVKYVIFRYLTSADYFNIYKPSGTEVKGGGQAYIDFPTAVISVSNWGRFFDGAQSVLCSTGEQGPVWEFPINSIGLSGTQELKIYQRRPQSICIASQRITSGKENRVKAWRPENGFPQPENPIARNAVPNNLVIYILRTAGDEFWAGWFLGQSPCKDARCEASLKEMFTDPHEEGYAGFIDVRGEVLLDENAKQQPLSHR
jgi:5-methylcytosine-specific restriction enzyme A